MTAFGRATLELRDRAGHVRGHLHFSTLPKASPEALVDRAADPDRLVNQPPIQAREAQTYHYRAELTDEGPLKLEPAELFDADDETGLHGRFRPGEAVGLLEMRAYLGDTILTLAELEVRAAKLEHEAEYRQMLRDISEFAAEALMQGFQPAAGAFRLDERRPVDLTYRRFAMLHARLSDANFRSAVAHILARPHHDWTVETEHRSPSRPLGGGTALQRALVRGHPRRDWPDPPPGVPLSTLPRTVEVTRHETTLDTLPNRLVKFALEDWRAVVVETQEAVERNLTGAPRERGLRATASAFERLDEWLSHPTLRRLGALTTFPQGNQVLLKREGYRQMFAAWMLSSSGADVAIDLDDPLRISQRNIATLYEYWCFLQLSEIVGALCGVANRTASLFQAVSGGMALGLRQGKESRLAWTTTVAGRRLAVELYFNRSFLASTSQDAGSWSRAMRPDCSLRIRAASGLLGGRAERLENWLHFDAKYRVDQVIEQFDRRTESEELVAAGAAETIESVGVSKRADLLKMHAYRDAIKRTAGAYVLFPGTAPRQFALDAETLPGIGAFPLRPSSGGGEAAGSSQLRDFIADVMNHAANQATRHERSRFWQERIAVEDHLVAGVAPPMESLEFPPADTPVLLVPIERAEQLERMLRLKRCFVPSLPSTTPSAHFLLFHGAIAHQVLVRRIGDWVPVDPPGSGPHLSCQIAAVDEAPWWIDAVDVATLTGGHAGVHAVTWLQLTRGVSPPAER
jgi:hypothetical protein